jgi:hypothetical protein
LPPSPLPSLSPASYRCHFSSPSVSIALFVAVVNALSDAVAIDLAAPAITLIVAVSTALFGTCHLVAIAIAQLRRLPLLPSIARHPCCRSHCFLCHRQCHHHFIAVSKRWAMGTATAVAALRAMALGNCGGGSSNEDSCCDSEGEV